MSASTIPIKKEDQLPRPFIQEENVQLAPPRPDVVLLNQKRRLLPPVLKEESEEMLRNQEEGDRRREGLTPLEFRGRWLESLGSNSKVILATGEKEILLTYAQAASSRAAKHQIEYQRWSEEKGWLPEKRWHIWRQNGGGLLIIQLKERYQRWPSSFADTFLRKRYTLREKEEDDDDDDENDDDRKKGQEDKKEKEINGEKTLSWPSPSQQQEQGNDTVALIPGLYGMDPNTRLTPTLAKHYGLHDVIHADIDDDYDEGNEKGDMLGQSSQLLVLAADNDTSHDFFKPHKTATNGRIFFDMPYNSYLMQELSEDTVFLWFKGNAPIASQFVCNATENRVPVLEEGLYSLWAMQYEPQRTQEQQYNDVDMWGAPLIRWRRLQLLTANTGYRFNDRVGQQDILVREDITLMPNKMFTLPNSLLTGRPFERWRWRPLSANVWRPTLPPLMKQGQMADPGQVANEDARGEYALQGVYRASQVILEEPLLRLLHAAEDMNLSLNINNDDDDDDDVGSNLLNVTDVMHSLHEERRKIDSELNRMAKSVKSTSLLMAFSLDDQGALTSMAEKSARLLQFQWMISHYSALIQEEEAASGDQNVIASMLGRIILPILSDSIDSLIITENDGQGGGVGGDDEELQADNLLSSIPSLDRLVPALTAKVATYAPAFSPALLTLFNKVDNKTSFLESINEHYELFVALETSLGINLVTTHPLEHNVDVARSMVRDGLDISDTDFEQASQLSEQRHIRSKRLQAAASMEEDETHLNLLNEKEMSGFVEKQQQYENATAQQGNIARGTGSPVPLPGMQVDQRQQRQQQQQQDSSSANSRGGGLFSFLLGTQISSPIFLQLGTSTAMGTDDLLLWQKQHALLYLMWIANDNVLRFPQPQSSARSYIHVVHAAVEGRDVNTGKLYNVANPEWGASIWTPPIVKDVDEHAQNEREAELLRYLHTHLIDDRNLRLEVPLYPLLKQLLEHNAPKDSTVAYGMEAALRQYRVLEQRLRLYIESDSVVKRSVRGLIKEARDIYELPIANLERVVRAYELVEEMPDFGFADYRTLPGYQSLRKVKISHPMELRGGATGVWVGMPSSWRSGPQVHNALDQVIERLEALNLVKAREKHGRASEEEVEETRQALKQEPFNWSSLYVALDDIML